MRIYAADVERKIRSQALVREWTKSGLLDAAQGERLDAELRVDVRRTNNFLRAGLAFFTALVVGASTAFVGVVFDVDGEFAIAVLTAVSAAACFWLAQRLVVQYRFYRFGVEEALAVASAVLMAIGAAAFVEMLGMFGHGRGPRLAGLIAAAGALLAVYRRFGYVYAAVGALACTAAVPFQLDVAPSVERWLAATILAAAYVIARASRSPSDDQYMGDDAALLQAAAWTGIYLALNLQLNYAQVGGPFYGFTYVMIWLLPAGGLFLAIRDKDRALLDVSLVMALVTLLTNKAYLGWPRHPWDPILLGILLIAAGIGVRRWLSAGPGGQRAGFTAARILNRESGAVTMVGTVSAGFNPDAPSYPDKPDDNFGGGRSGGAGASGSF
jgi:hypothetical protein